MTDEATEHAQPGANLVEGVQLLGAAHIRSLAQEAGIHPTKIWGQNFVIDPSIVRMIVELSEVHKQSSVIEIGPGLGSLTLALLEVDAHVTVVEIDKRLAEKLPHTIEQYAPGKKIRIINKDALTVTSDDVIGTEQGTTAPEYLIANLPYNVSVPVLLHFLSIFPSLRKIVVMVQKEVAMRLAAQRGNKIYGVPSVKANFFGAVTCARSIPSNVFWPKPHVDSALVVINKHIQPPWPMDTAFRQHLFTVIDAAFSARRKTLRQSLATWAGGPEAAENILIRADIEPSRRAETLNIHDFVRLAQV